MLDYVSRQLAPEMEEIRRRLNEIAACFPIITGITAGDGIDITGSTISVDLAPNPCLEFSAAKLQVQLADTTLSCQPTGLRVDGLNANFEVAGVSVGATVTAANFDTLTDMSNADALHSHVVGGLPPATHKGQVLFAQDGAAFTIEQPIVAADGWLANDAGQLLIEGIAI